MDSKRIALILLTVIMASGCTLPGQNTSEPSSDDEIDLAEERGLKIVEFRPTDMTLIPSQEAILNLRVRNYHRKKVNITDLFTYNEGLLTVENRRCTPDPEDLKAASAGNYPVMECKWDLTAPEQEEYGFPSSKPASINLHLEYESALTNKDPFKIRYEPLEDINSTSNVKKTFGNSEVRMTVSTESPVPTESERVLEVRTREVGKGRIASDTNYKFDFTPDNLFENCEKEKAPVVGKEVEFSCKLKGGQRGTRNLLFSTSYKYVKEPILNNVKLVNNQ